MEIQGFQIVAPLVLFVVSLIVSRIPYVFKNLESRIHLLLAVSSGIMLGILFLMILPEAIEESAEAGLSYTAIMGIILAGFLAVYIINYRINVSHGHEHTHEFTSMAAFGGMMIHAIFDGISIAAGFAVGEDTGVMILAAMCVHKCAEVFSLSSTMTLAVGQKKATWYMVAYSAVTPIAMFVSYFLITGEPSAAGPAMALSSGILLFVVICDMLPEVFHHAEEDGPVKRMVTFLCGLGISVLVWYLVHLLTNGQGL